MIDANNAMHAMPDIARELAHDRNLARDSLLRMLEPLVADGNRVTVVFDGREGRGSLQKYRNLDSYDVVYSSSSEGADGVIERMVMVAKNPGRICVVTNDNLIRNCAYAHGASAMRVEEFVKRLDHSIDQVSRRANFNKSRSRSERVPFHNRIEFPEGDK
ncbi:NYN domain-containing protein [bacterium]|nr:NYN domain-containing protein [bacterium]